MAVPDMSLPPTVEPLPAFEGPDPGAPLDARTDLEMLGRVFAPLAVALVAVGLYAFSLPGGFPFDDRILLDRLDPANGASWSFPRLAYDGYWEYAAVDRDYRPLTFISYAANFELLPTALGLHLVNLLLHAAAAVLAYFVLGEILRDRLLAALGAALFAALPILTDAVGSLMGRAEVLAGITFLGAWLIALKNSPLQTAAAPREGAARADGLGLAALCGLVTLIGLFAKENAGVFIPILIVVGSWFLRRPVPWRTAGCAAFAVGGYLLIQAVVISGKPRMVTFLENPLVITAIRAEDPRLDPRLDDLEGKGKDPIMQLLRGEFGVDSSTPFRAAKLAMTRALNGIRLLGAYAVKTTLPVRLSADYGYKEIPVLGLSKPALWAWAGGVVLVLGGAMLFLRRRLPIAALAAAVFLLALIPQANLLSYARGMFAERYAYAAAFAWPLLLCALARRFSNGLDRTVACTFLGVLLLLYGYRTGVRAHDWSDASGIMARTAADAPASTIAPLWSAGEKVARWQRSPPKERPQKRELLANADALLKQSLANDPTNARAHALYADVLLYQGKWVEALESLNRAEEGYLRQYPPERKPPLYERRAQIYWLLKKHKESFEDYDLSIRLLEGRGQLAQAASYSARALLRAQLAELNAKPGQEKAVEAELREALHDLDRALLLKPDDLAIWNDRGFCRFKLQDFQGAIEDYRQGLEIAKEKGIQVSPRPGAPSVMSFHEKLANAYMALAQREHAAGNEGSARAAQAEALNHAREATRRGSPHFKPPAPAPAPQGTTSSSSPAPAGGVGKPEPGAPPNAQAAPGASQPAPVPPGTPPEARPEPEAPQPAPGSKD